MYVICRKCGKEAQEISKSTAYAYQYHPRCRPWDMKNQEREAQKQAFFAQKRQERRTVS